MEKFCVFYPQKKKTKESFNWNDFSGISIKILDNYIWDFFIPR